jgi:hypothetical protein
VDTSEVDVARSLASLSLSPVRFHRPEAIAIFSDVLPQLLVKPKYGPLLKTRPRDIEAVRAL